MTFAEGAKGWWRIASTVLHWSPNQFWNATPSELLQSLPSMPEDVFDGVSLPELQALVSQFPDRGQT